MIVAAALIEELLRHFGGGLDVTNIRMLRVFRLVRVVRAIRLMRFFRELRLMVYGLQSSCRSLLWAGILLLLCMFMFGVYITQSVTDVLEDRHRNARWTEHEENLQHLYGTLPVTIFRLFQSITGGATWGEIVDPLIKENAVHGLVYSIFISLSLWAIMNVITGVFVDGMMKTAEQDTENVVKEEMLARREYMENMRKIFAEADTDGYGFLTWNHFERCLGNAQVRAYFRKLELDILDARFVFNLLDFDGDGHIDMDEFVLGFTQLKGQAKSLDIARLRCENLRIVNCITSLRGYVERMHENMQDHTERCLEQSKQQSEAFAKQLLHRHEGSIGKPSAKIEDAVTTGSPSKSSKPKDIHCL
eukprot:gnl/MRDRNA2_/MRDRNA2_261774_c0_seq1.p1 gnl/MRDRNA2_/MRDRNA2_261774_c0~~gnl/MRDRNA2_/MRDRNA2_261774_c0_seq1.p1  ORF type:complete len:381 (+),score=63.77 gnl/MRDRNA2_/MRDRNA2_261774_c0_seq1:62-1144(+)